MVRIFITQGEEHLAAMGYTEHGFRHARLVSRTAFNLMARLGFPRREAEVAAIAGYLHDIGHVAGRRDHPVAGAWLAFDVLRRLGADPGEAAVVMGAIGNHEEPDAHVVSNVSAGLILADKSDVHRTRVRNPEPTSFDQHDRVNYAVERSFLRVHPDRRSIDLELRIDTGISPVMEYFELFLPRMLLCRRAASFLGCRFGLLVNGVRML